MTYPPRPPGPYGSPDPYGPGGPPPYQYGPPPNPDGPPPGYAQPPTYGPPPGYGDPPGYGGPPGHVGPPSYASPPSYADPPGHVGPPGYGGPQPPRRRTGLVIGIVIAVVVLVGAGTGAYYLFFRHGDSPAGTANATPQQVVSGFAQAYTSLAHTLATDDLAKVDSYLCAADQSAMQVIYQHQKGTNSTDASFSMRTSDVSVQGAKGTFLIVISDVGGASAPRQGNLVRQNQRWLVCHTVAPPN